MDRTSEFFRALRESSVSLPSPQTRRQKPSQPSRQAAEFFNSSREINLRLQNAVAFVSQLDDLVNSDNILNENDPKIQQIISQLQGELSFINNSINSLEQTSKANSSAQSMAQSLRRSLAQVTKDFQTTVQTSSEQMMKVSERRKKIGYVSSAPTTFQTVYGQDEVECPLDQMAALEMEQLQDREGIVMNIERQTTSIVSMFQQLAEMISARDYDIVRIDENVQNALDNVMEGQKQMENYYNKVKNNKWFILKIFAVLFVFALVFILIL